MVSAVAPPAPKVNKLSPLLKPPSKFLLLNLHTCFTVFGKLWQEVPSEYSWDEKGPPREAKRWYSTFHTVTAMVGAGVLSLPYAMAYLGWYTINSFVLCFFEVFKVCKKSLKFMEVLGNQPNNCTNVSTKKNQIIIARNLYAKIYIVRKRMSTSTTPTKFHYALSTPRQLREVTGLSSSKNQAFTNLTGRHKISFVLS